MSPVRKTELPDLVWERLFQRDADGIAVLEELATRFYDQDCYTPGSGNTTDAVYRDGQRSVIKYIMARAGTVE